jgi:hypothetical protein
MGINLIHAIDIEDYDGTVIEHIKFEEPIEIEIDNINVSNFNVIDVLKTTKENTIRLQFDGDFETHYDMYDVDEASLELIDCIRLESEDLEIGKEMYDQIYNAIKTIIAPNF